MNIQTFDRALLDLLAAKKTALDAQIASLRIERDVIVTGMQSVCTHADIKTGTYTFGSDSYSGTWHEGTTYTCKTCGLYERGSGGPVYMAYQNR